MLALPKRVGIRPIGAFLRCPQPSLHCTFLLTSRLPALRADVIEIYPAFSFNRPCGLHGAGSGHRTQPARSGSAGVEGLQGGWVNLPSLPASSSVLPLKFQRWKRSPRQRRTKTPTPRFSFLEVYGCHPHYRRGAQALTRSNAGLCSFGL